MDRQALRDSVYLAVANDIKKLSKDKNTQIGAVIIGADNTPVSWGYNGTVQGFNDNVIPHSREMQTLRYIEDNQIITFDENKYPFMEHAERNALDFADPLKLVGATLYVTGAPCKDCALRIAKRKIARVVIDPMSFTETSQSTVGKDFTISKFIFANAGIKVFVGDKEIQLNTVE